jgi:hypothetical protein
LRQGDRTYGKSTEEGKTPARKDGAAPTLDWFDVVMSTRVNDPKTAARVVVMQRCHQQDLSGHLLEQGGWEHLCLPAEYETSRRATSIGFVDPRHDRGKLLWPERFGPAELESLKRSLGSYATAGQLQQRPTPTEGGLLKRHWFRYWQPRGASLPPVVVRLPAIKLWAYDHLCLYGWPIPLPTSDDRSFIY